MNYAKVFKGLTNTYGKISSSLPEGWALPPIHAIIELTYNCNLRCKMCYLQEIRKSKAMLLRKELSTQDVKKIIDWMLPKTLITLTGGELFIRRDAKEIISYCCKNHSCNFVTNAALVNKDIAEFLVKSGVRVVGVSIDGIGTTHDEIRMVKGTFKKAIHTIKLIQDAKKKASNKFPLIDIKTVVLNENVKEITEIYRLSKKLGANYLTISAMKPEETVVQPPFVNSIPKKDLFHYPKIKQKLPVKELEAQLTKISKNGDGPEIRFYPNNIDKYLEGYYTNTLSSKSYGPCSVPWERICVSPYGDVVPCFPIVMGNIKRSSLGSIWNGPRFRKFRKDLKKNEMFYPACNGCCNADLPVS